MISRRGGGSDFVFGPREVKVPKIDSDFVRLAGSDRAANATADDRALVPIDVELLVLEQFPPELRRALNESATKLNSLAFVDHYNWAVRQGLGAQRTLRRLAEIERNELEVFAGKYKAECQGRLGRDETLPHVGAAATVQRYGALGPSSHPPRRLGPAIVRPRKKTRFRP